MNDHDQYMADFMNIFSGLECWGPSAPEITEQSLEALPFAPKSILEVGCGNGIATLVLAKQSDARIVAVWEL